MIQAIAQMGIPGGPELLIILFILTIPLAVLAAVVFVVLVLRNRSSTDEDRIDELERRIEELED